MRLIVSYDGREIHVKQGLAQFETYVILSDSLICMTDAGEQITETVMQGMVQRGLDQAVSLYVFDRHLLYAEPAIAAAELEWPIHPAEESAQSVAAWANGRLELCMDREAHAAEIEKCLRLMCESTSVALANLQRHAADVKDAVKSLDELAATDMADMEDLLGRYATDLAVISKVPVSSKLLGKPIHTRMLGDYINESKMHTVAEVCRRELFDMQERHANAQHAEAGLCRDMDELAAEIEGLSLQPSIDTVAEIVRIAREVAALAGNAQENAQRIAVLDGRSHAALAQLVSDRNEMLGLHLNLVQDVSSVQSDFAELTETLTGIDADLATKLAGFKHLARLRRMLGAYATSLVEGVRRHEFTHAFITQAQSLAELMARIGAAEQTRRKNYLSDVATLLPWDVAGLENIVPALEISTRRDTNGPVFERQEVEGLLATLVAIEEQLGDKLSRTNPVAETRELIASILPSAESASDSFAAAVRRELNPATISDNSDASDSDPAPGERAAIDQLERERVLHADTQAMLARVTSERDAACAREERLRDEVAATERTLRSERDEARKAHAEVSARLDALLAQGASAEVRIEELHKQLTKTQAELQQARALAEQQSDSRGAASRRRLEAELKERTVQMARLHSEVDAARTASDVLQSQLHTAEVQRIEMSAQLEGANSSVAHAQTEKQRAERECSSVAASAAELVRAVASLRRHILDVCQAPTDDPTSASITAALDALQSGDAHGAEQALRELDPGAIRQEIQSMFDQAVTLSQKWERAYRSASGKYATSASAARERVALRNFEAGNLALFVPSGDKWTAFNVDAPNYFLGLTDELKAHLESREWLLARIVRIDKNVAEEDNMFGLAPGTPYAIVDVEGWQDMEKMLRTASTRGVRSVSDPFVTMRPRAVVEDTPRGIFIPAPSLAPGSVVCVEQANARFALGK
ncbi:oligomeric, coiled-coil, peripheral membrane protein [Malassezia cuniculi]|uniref:Autophagy-related protein 11 n=1 Tax=Malassezia cuniculi TaxID=948313 RepID=A0AAF0ESQ2_9BASI|nr:oligomeric, coiled-coil, peripheral membrane protein [Malassezia cuniculi]